MKTPTLGMTQLPLHVFSASLSLFIICICHVSLQNKTNIANVTRLRNCLARIYLSTVHFTEGAPDRDLQLRLDQYGWYVLFSDVQIL